MQLQRTTYTSQDFAWTQWDVATILALATAGLEVKRREYDLIKAIPAATRTFENTIYALDKVNSLLVEITERLDFLMNVSPDAAIRAAAKAAVELIQKEDVDIEYDPEMYQAVKAFAATNPALEGADKKLFDDTMLDYRRMGFELPVEQYQQLKDNLKRLSQLGSDFDKNINDWEDHILVTREELDGLPENYIARLEQQDSKYKVTLKYPDLFPFLQFATNAARRKELADKDYQKGGQQNLEILKEMINLHDTNARLLGYPNHLAYRTEVKMAKNQETVAVFIDELIHKLTPGVQHDVQALTELKRRETGDANARLEYYDVAYYSEKSRQALFSFNSEKVREYFPLQIVLKGMFEIYERLLSVKFTELSGYPTWHKDVQVFSVTESTGEILGYFMLDLYPRPNKYSHAAMFSLNRPRVRQYKGVDYVTPMCAMVANFPKPSAEHPSLLNHGEVRTLFHEFGHVMHGILTSAPYAAQSGTSVARDFVEGPSQMLENWIWNQETLDLMSGHYQTGEKIPNDLMMNMQRARKHLIAYGTMRQFIFSRFDVELHSGSIANPQQINELYNDLVQKHAGITLPPENIFAAGFGHLNGYDGGYYGYMWALVYSYDMFMRFETEGLLNPQTGRDYRTWILEKGSSMEEMDLLRGFLGREPNSDAFLKEIGLSK